MLRPGFDPNTIGFSKAAGWAACYAHNWPRVLRLMLGLNHRRPTAPGSRQGGAR